MPRFHKQGARLGGSGRVQRRPGSFDTDAEAHFEEHAMKRVIATTAVLLAAFGLATQVQARDHGNDQRGGQQHSGQARAYQDRGGHDYRPGGNDRGRDYGRDYRPGGNDRGRVNGRDSWRDQGRNNWRDQDGWRDRNGWRDRDDHRWGTPYYRDYGYRYPRYDYSRPYYGDSWRYYRPPVYRGGYYDDCDDYYYDCDDDGFSLLFSLPLHF
jgi:hypothetical protein